MTISKLYYFVPGAIAFSLTTHAATTIIINEDNIDNHFTVSAKTLVAPNKDYQFKLVKKVTLSNGLVKNKYSQFYKGVPVFNSVLTSSEAQGRKMDWYGNMLSGIEEDIDDVTPNISKDFVLNARKKQFLAEKDSIQNESVELFVRMSDDNKAELIYLVSFSVMGSQPKHPYFMVNAHTGAIISSWDGLTTRNAEGPGGNEKAGSYYYGRDFSSLDVTDACEMKNANVETYDMKNQTSGGGTLFKFVCPVNNYKFVNGAYSPLNDAHYFGGIVFSMYKDWYNTTPLTTKLMLHVHFGTNYQNAFWDKGHMYFGDGGSSLYPLTSLDIMAHEVSHGLTEQNSNLKYEKQSGGINEAFSDMAGETAEYFMNQQVGKENDWLCGASVMKGAAGTAMRYFKNPPQDGNSIDNANNYNDAMDVHYTSGVFNKAFYNLSTKPNWGIKKAFGTFLIANKVYWQREATFNSAACGVAKAAADMKYEVADVIASFKAVGVDANCAITPTPTPTPGKEIELENATTISNLAIKAGEEYRYFIKVPVVSSFPYGYDFLFMRAYNTTGNASNTVEMFLRYDMGLQSKVTPTVTATGDEMFMINKPSAGTYHILLKGKAAGTINLTAFYANKAS